MARNEEKAMNLFNKWTTFKKEFHSKSANKHPLLSSECDSLVDAEKVRRDILKELSRKIPAIQNANLGEFRIRELNDEINKLMGRKFYWEKRIRELGGSDFKKGRNLYDIEGKELPGMPGYKYFGAAKDLPGVRELFAQADEELELQRKRKSRKELSANITPDYYGYRDDDDGVLLAKEQQHEKRLRAEAQAEYQKQLRLSKIQNIEVPDKFGRKLVTGANIADSAVAENEAENDRIELEIASWLDSVSGVDISMLASLQQERILEAQKQQVAAIIEEKKQSLFEKFGI